MAILARFQPANMTAARYAQVMSALEAAGLSAPQGRIHHAAYGPAERLCVVDLWDTPESFQSFGARLFPILAAAGVDMGAPEVSPLHNVVRG